MSKLDIYYVADNLLKHEKKKYKRRNVRAITSIAIHHSMTELGSSQSFARYHVNSKNWPGIGYHYVIYKNGKIEQTNKIGTVSYHVGKSNYKAIGICLIGDFTVEEPTDAQLQSTAVLCRMLIDEYPNIEEIKGHSDYPGYEWKKCPAIDVKMITNRMPESWQ